MITAIIPARGGSKRIPNKNIKMYCDKPLLVHSIEQAQKSNLIERIFVSTDSDEIANIARQHGAEIIMRPENISQDNSTDYEFMKHFLDIVDFEVKMLVQMRPTYPNRDVNMIDTCIVKFLNNSYYDSLRTVIPNIYKTPYKMYFIENNELKPLISGDFHNMPDQRLNKTYIHNGYIDCIWPKTILEKNSVTGSKIYPFIMDENEVHDIDILEDFINSTKQYRKTNKKVIKIGNKFIGEDYPCFFIAEAGINHNGKMENAYKLIDLAVLCGADCVKFQKRTISRILTKEGLEKPYTGHRAFGPTYGEHKKFLELNKSQFQKLKDYADKKGILFTGSGWDEESVDLLDDLGVDFFKIGSPDLTNFPLLEHTAKKGKPIVFSTGMADMDTVIKAYDLLSKYNNNLVILQCTSSYPSEPEDAHLNVLQTYKKRFPNAIIGFSSHERGLPLTLASVALGAKVVERHFTLDRTMKGGDHAASLEEPGLKRLIRDIKVIEKGLGQFEKRTLECEEACFLKLAKSLVSNCNIPKGSIITREMLTTKGPGRGISPMRINEIIGLKTIVDIDEDVVLEDKMFE